MSSHYNLKATIDGTEVVGESLELTGSKPFKVFPVSKNTTNTPIRGSAVVSILGKNYSIQLNHKIRSQEDPETYSTKWSYIENMYITGTTPVASEDIKSQDTAYVRASRGRTIYNPHEQSLIISKAYTTYQALMNTVGDFSDASVGTTYLKTYVMDLFTFVMFYKYSKEVGGVIIPPTDDGTPASNKERIPCRPDVSGAPDWIRNPTLTYRVVFTNSQGSGTRDFNTWSSFITFWDSIQTNPEYSNAIFHYIYKGTVDFNELLTQRGSNTITVSEIDNGKGIGIHGAKPLYLIISQQEGKVSYSVSMIPAETSMWGNDGSIRFNEPSPSNIDSNRCSRYNINTYHIQPKFRIKSDQSYWASPLNVLTGGSVIVNPDPDLNNTVNYQYIGQPFILKLFKETSNGIEGISMRPYYKITSTSTTTEFWKDRINIIGSQHFNPLKYNGFDGDFHQLLLRPEIGYRGVISGPITGNYGMCIFQLIPLCLYTIDSEISCYNPVLSLNNWNIRYLNYQSAIGSIPNDRLNGAFLKWPNSDGNNDPDHIETGGDPESLPSYVGKDWEHDKQYNAGFKVINRVMFVPVLWTENPLEGSQGLREYLSSPKFGFYMFSPNITDSDIDLNPEAPYRVHINGLNIQIS